MAGGGGRWNLWLLAAGGHNVTREGFQVVRPGSWMVMTTKIIKETQEQVLVLVLVAGLELMEK